MNNKIEQGFSEKSLITLLLLLAVILGLVLLTKDSTKEGLARENNNSTQTKPSEVNGDLTDEQKVLRYNPKDGSGAESSQVFLSLVNKLAVTKNELEIRDCVSSPTVLKVKFGSGFIVNNKGKSDINFGILDERVLVRAGEKKEVVANYKNGTGIYGYGCDDPSLNRSVGILVITQ
jgi:hypothetical protein